MIHGPVVLVIQKVLSTYGCKVFADGVMGPQTWAALIDFSQRYILPHLMRKRIKQVLDESKRQSNTKHFKEEKQIMKILEAKNAGEIERLLNIIETNKKMQMQTYRRQKKEQKQTATDIVLSMIYNSKQGLSTDILSEKTGFDKKKIQNIVYRLKKQRKIQRTGRGIYNTV